MRENTADFAILGATVQARLVAGLLASTHGKSVVFIGESQALYRLPRSVDLSIGPITRPQTWALLRTCVPETLKLVSRIGGRGAWSHIDPILFAEAAAGREALAHIRHMAAGFGHAVEPVAAKVIGSGREGFVFRDAALLHRAVLEAKLDAWLDELGVQRFAESQGLTIRSNGSAELTSGDVHLAIGQTVLADDRALMAHLTQKQWPGLFLRQPMSTVFTEPARSMAGPVLVQLDRGSTLAQQPSGSIAAFGPGSVEQVGARLIDLLGHDRAVRQAGQSRYEVIATTDGAPAVGRLGGSGPAVLAGFGAIGAFLAPAIARWLCGVASAAENDWLGSRLVNRGSKSASVAEFGGGS